MSSVVCVVFAIVSQALAVEDSTVVVATEVNAELFARMERIRDWHIAVGECAVDVIEWQRRLTGLANPALPDAASIEAMLDSATDCEARFDRGCALRLREEVLHAYDNNVVPRRDLVILAARALHDMAAAELADERPGEAARLGRVAMRRFSNVPLDNNRHPPAVAHLLASATVELRRAPVTNVTFRTTRPGRVFLDGTQDQAISEALSWNLPQGSYRVWIADGATSSLMHEVTVASTAMTVDIDFALESALSWQPVPQLRCGAECPQRLRALARRVGVSRALGLSLPTQHAPALGAYVRASDGRVETIPIAALSEIAPPMMARSAAEMPSSVDRFSAWSLLPFGVGQLAQERYVSGAIHGGVQVGLLAWHVVAASRASSYDGPSPDASERRREQRNLSGALLIGAAVASVIEAVVVGAVAPN